LELLLNLVWVLVSAGIFFLVAAPSHPQSRYRRYSSLTRCVAALVLTFLLLPVISMTDDLHAMPAMADGERAAKPSIATVQALAPVNLLFAQLARAFFHRPRVLGFFETEKVFHPEIAWISTRHSNRAPPALRS
jgi:hypothetical protein